MMAKDLGVEAKEAAVREVAKLLSLPEHLLFIASIKADYISRQQANDAQLSTMLVEQVEQAQEGLESLSLSETSTSHLRENFAGIEKLCQECQTLIDNHNQIKLLSNARNNLNTTLKDVKGMMSISSEASEARDFLNDDKELINTYERLTALDGKRRFALAAASSHENEIGRLREYFEDIDHTWEIFEKTLWGHISNFFQLSKDSPQTLVRALRVVEMQETLDQQLATEAAEAEGHGSLESITNPRRNAKYLPDWLEGQVTEYLVEIFRDYFAEVKTYIEERSFRRFAEACVEETIVVYVNHMLVQKNYIKEETIERMKLEEEVHMDFFREYISISKVENRVRVLVDLRELASAKSPDSFTLVYTNILEHQPDCPPVVVDKLMSLPEGIPRKDAKEVVQECREIYENSLVDGNPPKAGFVFPKLKAMSASRGRLWRMLT